MGKIFSESNETAVFTTRFVVDEKKEITEVIHFEEDGAWQFMGSDNFSNFEDVVKIVSLGQIIQMDSSITELADLPKGFHATRKSKNDRWIISKYQEK